MVNKINIEQIEEHLKQVGLDNGELENLLNPYFLFAYYMRY